MTKMNEADMQGILMDAVSDYFMENTPSGTELLNVRTFEDAGIMTYNKGVVVLLDDGSEFQITVVRSA